MSEPASFILHHEVRVFKHASETLSDGESNESNESNTISVRVTIDDKLNRAPLLLITVTFVPELPQKDDIATPPVFEYVQYKGVIEIFTSALLLFM